MPSNSTATDSSIDNANSLSEHTFHRAKDMSIDPAKLYLMIHAKGWKRRCLLMDFGLPDDEINRFRCRPSRRTSSLCEREPAHLQLLRRPTFTFPILRCSKLCRQLCK
eukprot:gnl/TRDRNA2_/TRDRNA2_122139_c0_seq1.p2 gnl/TRDRNA2_/TRDRNA2_122139_c0~~gnl/TRDRNA2_/TRDRNA2_122139_c0_seq1.p2  ORF type:complete len:108 (+),score=16.04 gnl/TRDRNA2_/TRDRNA2_122139_c0_seq1:332-655(+)